MREDSNLIEIGQKLYEAGGFKNEELRIELQDYLFRKYSEAMIQKQ